MYFFVIIVFFKLDRQILCINVFKLCLIGKTEFDMLSKLSNSVLTLDSQLNYKTSHQIINRSQSVAQCNGFCSETKNIV